MFEALGTPPISPDALRWMAASPPGSLTPWGSPSKRLARKNSAVSLSGAHKREDSSSSKRSWTSLLSPLLSSVLPTPPATPRQPAGQLLNGDTHLSPTAQRTFAEAVDRDKEKRPPSPLSLTGRLAAKRTKTRSRTRARRLLFLCIFALAFASVINNFFHSIASVWSKRRRRHRAARAAVGTTAQEYVRTGKHPIRVHLERAHATWNAAITHQSTTARDAVFEYRKRYGREPPNGFDEWFAFAKGNNYELSDEFDAMMDALEPFYGILPSDLRRRAVEVAVMPSFSLVQRAVSGEAMAVSSPEWDAAAPQGRALAALITKLGDRPGLVPFAMAIDEIGRPRVLPSWEENERVTEILINGPNASLPMPFTRLKWSDPLWDGDGDVWSSYARTCPPETSARRMMSALSIGMQATGMTDSGRVEWLAGRGVQAPRSRRQGPRRRSLPSQERSSSTLFEALDSPSFQFPLAPGITDTHESLCNSPTLHDQHSMFFSDYRTINDFYPVFSTAKIDGFADILIPSLPIKEENAPVLHRAKPGNFGRWSAPKSEAPWEARENRFYWRGEPTGECQTPPGYELNFARPRLVRKLSPHVNGTEDVVSHARQGHRQLAVVRTKRVSLNARSSNVAFTGLRGCGSVRSCATLEGGDAYTFAAYDPTGEGYRRAKAALDVDGDGDSTARFLNIVESGAAAVRGTIMRDAHTDQIMPWVHYIPVSPDFHELYHLHAYFLGSTVDATAGTASSQTREQNVPHHEGTMALKRIAQNGRTWRETHMRPVDAEVYIYRLALEYSRLWSRTDEEFWALAAAAQAQ